MSKKSHAKHEHKVQAQHDTQIESSGIPDEDFSKHHKALIWAVIIIMFMALPVTFAALVLLRII